MSTLRASFIGLVAFVVGGIITWTCVRGYYIGAVNQIYNNLEVGHMLSDVHTLERLRNGEITNAVENLEYQLDWTLIALTPFLEKKPESPIEETEVKMIQKARDYRAKFPRKSDRKADAELVAKAFKLLDAQSKP